MKWFFPLLLSVFLFAGCLQPSPQGPDTLEISGVLFEDTTLRGQVILGGDLLVPKGVTLRIEPGTTLYIRSSESTKIDPEFLSSFTELLVRGTLHCLGTEGEPVRFIPLSEEDDLLWAGIILDGADDSVVRGAEISGAETGILCIRTSPLIERNLIERCRYALIAQEKSSPAILSNRIEKGEGGVFCLRWSNPRLLNNTITDNEEEGIFVDRTSRPTIERNEISGNAIGLAYYLNDISFDSSHISGNVQDLRLLSQSAREGR